MAVLEEDVQWDGFLSGDTKGFGIAVKAIFASRIRYIQSAPGRL
jgi:hypothetical protein